MKQLGVGIIKTSKRMRKIDLNGLYGGSWIFFDEGDGGRSEGIL